MWVELKQRFMSPEFRFLEGRAEEVAPRLLGCELVRELDGELLIGRIVETEAYHQDDAASHSYRGQTPRASVMFGRAGHLYVYFTYGMHYCCNVVTGVMGEGSAVLIRALEPIQGEATMSRYRRGLAGAQLTNGPAKLCQAMNIAKPLNGHNLANAPLQLNVLAPIPQTEIAQTTRIGISKSKDLQWRFYVKNNTYVSKM